MTTASRNRHRHRPVQPPSTGIAMIDRRRWMVAGEPRSFGCGCVMRQWRTAGYLMSLTDSGGVCGDPAALELDGDNDDSYRRWGVLPGRKGWTLVQRGDGERTFHLHEAGDGWVVERITAAGVSVLHRDVSQAKAVELLAQAS